MLVLFAGRHPAITDQFMRRFEQRFGCAPVEWHSALSGPERGRVWRAVATGTTGAILEGARTFPWREWWEKRRLRRLR